MVSNNNACFDCLFLRNCQSIPLLGAKMNVSINTKSMKQREKAGQLQARADQLAEDGIRKADTIYAGVETALKAE